MAGVRDRRAGGHVYFAAGGLKAAASLNAVQLVVLLVASPSWVPLALTGVGGWGFGRRGHG